MLGSPLFLNLQINYPIRIKDIPFKSSHLRLIRIKDIPFKSFQLGSNSFGLTLFLFNITNDDYKLAWIS